MILNKQITNATTPTAIVDAVAKDNACRLQLDRLTGEIESLEVREIVNSVFDDLLRLLECLDLIANHLRQVEAAEDTFELFQLIHDEAGQLVKFIRTEALNGDLLNEELFDTLDGIAFAVKHDLQRVFESNATPANQTVHAMVGRLYRAHDILTNCLQQSTVTLAMIFDPELVGAKLFNNTDIRRRQSLQLCNDIADLIQLVAASETQKNKESLALLAAGTDVFRSDSMELLMYSDWPQFESFCERIAMARDDWSQLDQILHQFCCYLETLLGHVKRRAVLSCEFPAELGGDQAYRDPFADEPTGKTEWDSLALAG